MDNVRTRTNARFTDWSARCSIHFTLLAIRCEKINENNEERFLVNVYTRTFLVVPPRPSQPDSPWKRHSPIVRRRASEGFSPFQGISRDRRRMYVQHARCYPCESREYPPPRALLTPGTPRGHEREQGGRARPAVRTPALFSRRDKIGIAKNTAGAHRWATRSERAFPRRYHEFTTIRAGRILLRLTPPGEERNAKLNGAPVVALPPSPPLSPLSSPPAPPVYDELRLRTYIIYVCGLLTALHNEERYRKSFHEYYRRHYIASRKCFQRRPTGEFLFFFFFLLINEARGGSRERGHMKRSSRRTRSYQKRGIARGGPRAAGEGRRKAECLSSSFLHRLPRQKSEARTRNESAVI